MQSHYGKTRSLWMREQSAAEFLPLTATTSADICVVGTGIAGLMTAYRLTREGRSVILLESGDFCGGETSRTTAHLSFVLDDRYFELERLFGRQGARLAYQSHARAIDLIENIVEAEEIDCEFTRLDGYLFGPPANSGNEIQQEYDAAVRAGLPVEQRARVPLWTFDTGLCLHFPNQGQFNPLAFAVELGKRITNTGGRIHTHTHVEKVEGGVRPRVQTADGLTVEAEAVVLATNTPIGDNLTIHARQAPYRTYAVAMAVPWDEVPRALYWDMLDPYHYVRLKNSRTPGERAGTDTLIIGGEDHKQGEADDEQKRFGCLLDWARARFPVGRIEAQWSGMVLEPADSLAFIGRDNNQQNVYIATGDSGHGMTHGAIASILLTDLIAGRTNEWESLYSPARVTAQAATDYISENLDVVANLGSWLTPGQVSEESEITPGTGAIMRSGLAKHAVYRDVSGTISRVSAVCSHLGCIVAWNSAEKTWDCPCHGSRFDSQGKVLRGPATHDLEKIS